MTPRELYEIALHRNLQDAHIRICDGMAVHYYPETTSVHAEHYEIVIDVSDLEPLGYDDLENWRQIINDWSEIVDR